MEDPSSWRLRQQRRKKPLNSRCLHDGEAGRRTSVRDIICEKKQKMLSESASALTGQVWESLRHNTANEFFPTVVFITSLWSSAAQPQPTDDDGVAIFARPWLYLLEAKHLLSKHIAWLVLVLVKRFSSPFCAASFFVLLLFRTGVGQHPLWGSSPPRL